MWLIRRSRRRAFCRQQGGGRGPGQVRARQSVVIFNAAGRGNERKVAVRHAQKIARAGQGDRWAAVGERRSHRSSMGAARERCRAREREIARELVVGENLEAGAGLPVPKFWIKKLKRQQHREVRGPFLKDGKIHFVHK